jgi:hypothetical protein
MANNDDPKTTPLTLKEWLLAPEPRFDGFDKMIPKRGRMRGRIKEDLFSSSEHDSDVPSQWPDTPTV